MTPNSDYEPQPDGPYGKEGKMNNPDSPFSIALQLLTLMMIVGIFIVLVNFTRSPVTITTFDEANEIIQIQKLDRELQALKRRVGVE